MQRAGQVDAEGNPVRKTDRAEATQRLQQERTKPRQFVREVISELKKVGWPTCQETTRLSIIVFLAIVVMTAFIFVIDLGFNEVVSFIFPSPSSLSTVLPAVLPFL